MLKKLRAELLSKRSSKQSVKSSKASNSPSSPSPVRCSSFSPDFAPTQLCQSLSTLEKQAISTSDITTSSDESSLIVDPISLPAPGSMMTSSTPAAGRPELPLSVLVLLPSSAHMTVQHGPIAPISRPPQLTARQSGSSVATLATMRTATQPPEKAEDGESSGALASKRTDVNTSSRRLSLAPGMGSGTQTRMAGGTGDGLRQLSSAGDASSSGEQSKTTPPPFGRSYRMSDKPSTSSLASEEPARMGPAAFGSRMRASDRGSASKRRPRTANNDLPIREQAARGSMALPSGMGLGLGGGGKNRPGWEGDEVVGMLRNSGMEVTVIRNASHLPAVLTPKSTTSSPTIPSFASAGLATRSDDHTPVILVPLGDSPTLPSLSLLMSEGTTTTTAVCFQQDLLDRAKRTEDEWLPSAIEQIRVVIHMREQAMQDGRSEKPIVLAYSANPALSPSTVSACLDAGVSGVLRPTYGPETAKLVKRMVTAAREGKVVLGMDGQAERDVDASGTKVNLAPTALFGGGEHETERALISHRRKMSGAPDVSALIPNASSSRSASARRRDAPPALTISPALASTADHLEADMAHLSFALYQPATHRRRRSVDTGGLATAMRRAQKAFEVAAKPIPIPGAGVPSTPMTPQARYSRLGGPSGSQVVMTPGRIPQRESEIPPEDDDTHLAELLGAMYYQTCVTIDVQMEEYAKLSQPIDREHRSYLIDALDTWDFRPHRLEEDDLYRVACLIFEAILHTEGVAELGLDQEKVNCLLFAIREIYHAPNPYHNYIHAIDVLQATYSFLMDMGVAPPWSFMRNVTADSPAWRRPDENESPVHGLGTRRAREVLRPQDVLAVIVAAMGHDVGHPGLSNAFMKNAKTPLSEVYDDKSVLENMHCMLVVQLLRKHGFGFLLSPLETSADSGSTAALAEFDSKGFRRVLYSSVLATDMSLHFAWIARLKELGGRVEREEVGLKTGAEAEAEAESDRIMICQAVIKCADISNPTRPIDTSEHWSTVLLEEWAKQASLEIDLSLPVSVIGSADQSLQAKGQIGFIDLFTQPLFEAVSDVVPELHRYADSCAENRGLWSRRLESLAEAESTPLVQPVVAGASTDDRFQTLFPLSLPMSLVSLSCLEPGPLPPTFSSSIGSGSSYAGPSTPMRMSPVASLKTPQSSSSFTFGSCPTSSFSPTAKAMRAVYHANLLDQRHRLAKEGKGSPIPGVNISVDAFRRSSTPDASLVSQSGGGH